MMMRFLLAPLAAAAVFTAAPMAQAATVASLDLEGSIDAAAGGVGVFGDVTSFTAQFDPTVDLFAADDYLLEASLELDGFTVIDDGITVTDVSLIDIATFGAILIGSLDPAILDALEEATDVIAANQGVLTEIAPGVQFSFLASPFTFGPTSISGAFEFALVPTGVTAASGDPGDFAISASISTIAPVPLPASAPLLVFALGGIWAVRRRRKAA